jgi:hypothetical protein
VRRAVRALAALALLAAAPARAAEDPALAPFLARFRAALARGDAGAVADLTRLPFLFESEPRDREGFVRVVFPALFSVPVLACLATAEPAPEEGRWVTSCGVYLFYFGRVGGEVRLLEFAVDPEAVSDP